ncbi:MAG: ClpXP protease specificity-enhancing factor, partial [Gammaproteobacteria bacterium]|nr:ClpXP protease specificity-enhancing factor [Gammaproteobacteria bacterium]
MDHRMTPYLLVDAEAEGVVVPPAYIEEGQIVLNVSPDAIRNLEITDQAVLFDASFSGEAWSIEVPME